MSQLGSCKVCEHYKLHEQLGQISRFCHGAPPTVILLPGMDPNTGQVKPTLHSLWPQPTPADICGSFKLDERSAPKVVVVAP